MSKLLSLAKIWFECDLVAGSTSILYIYDTKTMSRALQVKLYCTENHGAYSLILRARQQKLPHSSKANVISKTARRA